MVIDTRTDPQGRPVQLIGYEQIPIPQHSSRGNYDQSCVVIHYTAGGHGRSTARWATGGHGRSWHFMGYRNGTGCQQVDLDLAAWHAGASEWVHEGGPRRGVNRYSIGVELANHGMLHRSHSGKFYYELAGSMREYHGVEPVEAMLVYENDIALHGWWEPYTPEQLDWLKQLLSDLADAGYCIDLVGHDEIAMPMGLRKRDPGPLFPWEAFARPAYTRRTEAVIHGV